MKQIHCILLLFVVLFSSSCKHFKNESYSVGFKVFEEYDKTRLFDTTQQSNSKYRPVKINLFYPSTDKTTSHEPLMYSYFLNEYARRMDYSVSTDSCKKASLELATTISGYLGVKTPDKVLNYKTNTRLNLKEPERKLPLIIYASSMNGGIWENPLLFENLVKNGYIIAQVNSVGLFPGFMAEAVDVNEQVKDILFTLNKMKSMPFIDQNQIGLLSWSLGGTSASKASMLSKEFKCLLSFDGTEIHYYGFDKEWDKQYNQIMKIAPYKPGDISVPYMYISSDRQARADSVNNILKFITSTNKYFLKLNNGIHENFSSLPSIGKEVEPKGKDMDAGRQNIISKLTLNFFNQYLKNSSVSIADSINKLLSTHPKQFSTVLP